MTRFSRWFQMLYDAPGDPGGGGGAPASGAPAGTSTAPPAGAPAAGAPAAGTGGAPGAGGVPGGEPRPTFQYAEDRSKWLPPHRYNEVAGRVQQLEQSLGNYQQRVRVLMGVAEPEDPRMKEVRDSLKQVAPGLVPFLDNPELSARLVRFIEQDAGELTGGNQAYFNRLAFETATSAVEEYAKAVGVKVEELPPSRVQWMARQLGSFIAADPSGDRQARYDMRDPSLVSELLTEMTGFIVNPKAIAGGTAAAAQVERARQLPQSGPRGAVPPPAGSVEKPKDKKAVHEAARQALLAGTNS